MKTDRSSGLFTVGRGIFLRHRHRQPRWTLDWTAVCLVAADQDPSIPEMICQCISFSFRFPKTEKEYLFMINTF